MYQLFHFAFGEKNLLRGYLAALEAASRRK